MNGSNEGKTFLSGRLDGFEIRLIPKGPLRGRTIRFTNKERCFSVMVHDYEDGRLLIVYLDDTGTDLISWAMGMTDEPQGAVERVYRARKPCGNILYLTDDIDPVFRIARRNEEHYELQISRKVLIEAERHRYAGADHLHIHKDAGRGIRMFNEENELIASVREWGDSDAVPAGAELPGRPAYKLAFAPEYRYLVPVAAAAPFMSFEKIFKNS